MTNVTKIDKTYDKSDKHMTELSKNTGQQAALNSFWRKIWNLWQMWQKEKVYLFNLNNSQIWNWFASLASFWTQIWLIKVRVCIGGTHFVLVNHLISDCVAFWQHGHANIIKGWRRGKWVSFENSCVEALHRCTASKNTTLNQTFILNPNQYLVTNSCNFSLGTHSSN